MFSVGAHDGFAIGLVILTIIGTIRKNKNTLRIPTHYEEKTMHSKH